MKRVWTLVLTACLLLGSTLPALAVSTAYAITVHTGSSLYQQGKTVTATGHVTYNGSAAPGIDVTWSAVKPGGGSTYQVGQMTTNAAGDYALSFVLPGAAETGSWSLNVAAGGTNGAVSFNVTTPPTPGPGPGPTPTPTPTLPGLPDTVSITSSSSVASGASLELTATALDAGGKTTTTTFTWTVENGTGSATLSGTTLTGVKAGTVTVKATASNNVSGMKVITVGVGSADSVLITSPGTVKMGLTLTLSATVKDAAGNLLGDPAVSWSVTGGTGSATMSGNVLTPTKAGTVTVKATSGAASGTMAVSITALTISSPNGNTTSSDQPTPAGSLVHAGPALVEATGTVTVICTAVDLAKDGTALVYYWNGAHWIAVPTTYTPTGATASVPGGRPVVLMTAGVRQFADTTSSWANADILKLQSLGLLAGDGTGNYHPNDAVDRYALAKMIALIANLNVTTPDMTRLNGLADADTIPAWARPYVAAVLNADLMKGTDVGFEGGTALTRAQAATVIGRMLPPGSPAPALTFTDTETIPSWAREGVQKAVGAGLLKGLPDNSFDPNSPLTRAQLAAVISRMLDVFGVR